MRPTVLKTPQLAAINTIKLEQTLPGASQAYAESVVDQKKVRGRPAQKGIEESQRDPRLL